MAENIAPDLKLEIAHVLTIDVVAYSTLLIHEQSRVMSELNRSVRNTPCFRAAEAEGKLIRLPTGDGMALVFHHNPEAPLECAMQISADLKDRLDIQLRMGIHSGPINQIQDVNDRSNVAGAGIDMAQRVMDCGDAGHILVSKRVADDLAPHARWNRHLHDLGECEVKHGRKVSVFNFYTDTLGNPALPQKLASTAKAARSKRRLAQLLLLSILSFVICAAAAVSFLRLSGTKAERSLAVLPFLDLSQARDQEYLSDGITEQIINSLAHIHGLFVLARTTAFAFKNKNMDVRQIGRQLHVTHVLEGSVTHVTGRVRVVAQLIDVANGYHLWSETYDSSEQDLLSLQSDVAQKVAAALQIELRVAETARITLPPTHDPDAYDLYLRGRYLLAKRTTESIYKALEFFQEAVRKDGRFALGHAGIANSYILLGEYGVIPVTEAESRAWPEVSAALQINPHLAEGHLSRAILLADFRWKWEAAEADYREAIRLDPNSATAHHWFALHLAQLGRTEEALQEIKTAQQHDPLAPIIRAARARILLNGRLFDGAVTQSRNALELEANFAPAYSILAQALAFQHQYREALEAVKRYVELTGSGDQELLELAYIQALAGQKTEARNLKEAVEARGANFSPYDMAAICVALGNHLEALKWLQRAIDQRSIDVEWLGVDPRLDAIRAEEPFRRILALLEQPPRAIAR